mgnify:CR=1 FL=1
MRTSSWRRLSAALAFTALATVAGSLFQDPETQAVLPRLRSDLLALLTDATRPGGLAGWTGDAIAWDDGWAVTYQAITPSWASYSGTKGGRVFYARAISMCGGGVIGMFEVEYSRADLAAFDPVVNRLVHSLKDSGTGWQC